MGNRGSLCSFCSCMCVASNDLSFSINNVSNCIVPPALREVFMGKESNCREKAVG